MKLKITIELSDPNNKNGVATVDKAIQELEKEIKLLSPEGTPISISVLASATLNLNSRIRKRNLSSHEILFSREQYTGDNIKLDDKGLSKDKMTKKRENHKYSEKSKFSHSNVPKDANAKKGDRVFVKIEGGKHQLRDMYVVVEIKDDKVTIVKLLHALDPDKATKLGQKKTVDQKDIYLVDPPTKKPYADTEDCVPYETEVGDHHQEEYGEIKCKPKADWKPFQETSTSSDSDQDSRITLTSESDETDYNSETDLEENSPDVASTFDIQFNLNDPLNNEIREEETENEEENDTRTVQEEAYNDSVETMIDPVEETNQEETFDYYQDLLDPNGHNPLIMPNPGENIIYYDTNVVPPEIVHAKVTPMFKTMKRKWPDWFNVLVKGSTKETSVNLSIIRWKFATYEEESIEDVDDLNKTDPTLNQHDNPIRVVDNPLNMPFPEVQSLDNILPLSSTPLSSLPQQQARISSVRPRGLLPMEIEDSPLHRPSGSRLQEALLRRSNQVKKILSKSKSDSSSS